MSAGGILQIIMVLAGILVLFISVISLAKRRMTEPFCLTWGIVAILIIMAGILLRPSGWNRYISSVGLLLVVLIGFCLMYGSYFMSCKISELMRKNNELAIQVSLLIREKEEMISKLEELENAVKTRDRVE